MRLRRFCAVKVNLLIGIKMQTKQMKQKVVEALKAKREKLSPDQQIKVLDDRLGKGIGAKKERTRLTSSK
jgi:hypothetical protein